MKGGGRCKITENKHSKMGVPLKYFWFKYLHVHGQGGGGFIMILPGLIPGPVLLSTASYSIS